MSDRRLLPSRGVSWDSADLSEEYRVPTDKVIRSNRRRQEHAAFFDRSVRETTPSGAGVGQLSQMVDPGELVIGYRALFS